MFIDKRALLVGVTLNACAVRSGREPSLFQLKPTMGVVTVAAPHRAFKDFMMEGQIELMFGFRVATYAELRLVHLQKLYS